MAVATISTSYMYELQGPFGISSQTGREARGSGKGSPTESNGRSPQKLKPFVHESTNFFTGVMCKILIFVTHVRTFKSDLQFLRVIS